METMEVENEVEKVLYKEDTERIKKYEEDLRFRVGETAGLLNKIAENYSFDSLDQIPQDIDSWILKLYLTRNKKAREQYDWQPFRLSEINLPEDLTLLRADLLNWSQWGYKDSTAYLIKRGKLYSVNSELIEREVSRFSETQRIYISGEQITRFKICSDMLRGLEYEVNKSGLDFNIDSSRNSILRATLSKNPFLSYIGYKVDGSGNRFTVNENYILTGTLI